MAAMQYKQEGNRLFTLKKYDEAIKQYTKAINKSESTAVFYTNRALCHLKLQRWDEVIGDCKRAIENDSQSVKGNFFLGQSELELEKYDEAITHLSRAHDLAKQQKLNFGDDIAFTLRTAKKKRWQQLEKARIQQEIELQSYLNNLILKDKERQLERRRKCEKGDVNTGALKEKLDEIETEHERRMEELNSIFAQIDDRRKGLGLIANVVEQARDVPDYLCGKISFEIMKDPVITPSGITYDRKDIEEHLQRVGHFDPVTRHELQLNQLIPNLAMREVITNFVDDNGWVEDY